MAKARALGKGLASLLPQNTTTDVNAEMVTIQIELLTRNPHQPRKSINEDSISELAASIKAHGIIQPIIVRKERDNEFQIIAGERRWLAAKQAGLAEVPVRIIDASEKQIHEMSLIENIQREDLSPLDTAHALNELLTKYNLTQEEIATSVGWSRSKLTNKVRLLKLPRKVRDLLDSGALTEGHCRALLGVDDEELLIEFAQKAVVCAYTVRQVESMIRATGKPRTGTTVKLKEKEKELPLPDGVSEFAIARGLGIKLTDRGGETRLQIDGIDQKIAAGIFEHLEENASKYFPGNK